MSSNLLYTHGKERRDAQGSLGKKGESNNKKTKLFSILTLVIRHRCAKTK